MFFRSIGTVLLFFLICRPTSLLQASSPSPGNTPSADCTFHPLVAEILHQGDYPRWYGWVKRISGADPITLYGRPTYIVTRNTGAMFTGNSDARAFEYLTQWLRSVHPRSQLQERPFSFSYLLAQNLVVTIPGQIHPEEQILFTAHLDSRTLIGSPAPGADDNAIGVAALLEALRIFRRFQFDRTIKLVFFTGEEQGMVGSTAFVTENLSSSIVGAVNLDMFGWDGDDDRCFEIHAGVLSGSQDLGRCLESVRTAYQIPLRNDFLTDYAITASDHSSFWNAGISAVTIAENVILAGSPEGCIGVDRNPGYHSDKDTVFANLHPLFAFRVAQAATATVATLAGPLSACFPSPPQDLAFDRTTSVLSWTPLQGASQYRIYRSTGGCEGEWHVVDQVASGPWIDYSKPNTPLLCYQVEGMTADGMCVSPPSSCLSMGFRYYLPLSVR